MGKERWSGTPITSSDDTVIVEGNRYFPMASVDAWRLRPSTTTAICPRKGEAHSQDIWINGADNIGVALCSRKLRPRVPRPAHLIGTADSVIGMIVRMPRPHRRDQPGRGAQLDSNATKLATARAKAGSATTDT